MWMWIEGHGGLLWLVILFRMWLVPFLVVARKLLTCLSGCLFLRTGTEAVMSKSICVEKRASVMGSRRRNVPSSPWDQEAEACAVTISTDAAGGTPFA